MAADVVLDPQTANPCCAGLRKRYAKLEEKRNALRQAVKLLECQTNKLEEERNGLRKAYEEETTRAEQANQANKELIERKVELEKEVERLKSEITSLKKKGNGDNKARIQTLVTQVSEGKAEIKKLKEQLKDSKKEDFEKKFEQEKSKSAEAWRLLKAEKQKAEEEKRLAEMGRKKAEEFKSEANEVRKKLELEKKEVIKEKRRADKEREKTEEQMRLVEIERNKLAEEKNTSCALSEKLQDKMQEIEMLRRKGTSKVRNEDSETASSKLLREKVKLQKQQLKHAKEIAKFHEAEKNMLLQQLYLLKQDHVQFSTRLEVLTSCFPFVIEGTNGLAKVGENLKKHNVKHRKAFSCAELNTVQSLIEPEKAENACLRLEDCHDTFVPLGGGYIKPVSGTCSDSVRDKSQSSAICSTDITFSDTRMAGPQGNGAPAVATSALRDLSLVPINELATGGKRKAEGTIVKGSVIEVKRKKVRKGEKNPSPMKNKPSSLPGPEEAILANIHEPSLFEALCPDDYMKLLELDDEEDEKRYQEARRMLLSPTLPEIRPPIPEDSNIPIPNIGFYSENSAMEQNRSFELTNQLNQTLEISTNDYLPSLGQSDAGKVLDEVFSEDVSVEDFLGISATPVKASQIDSYRENPGSISMDSMAEVFDERFPSVYDCVIIPSKMEDEHAFYRILQVMDAIIHETSWAENEGFVMTEAVHALSCKTDVSFEEKVSVICSLLLHKISTKITATNDLSSLSSSLLNETNKAISLFFQTWHPDIVIHILQDFMISKQIMVPMDDDHLHKHADISKQYKYKDMIWYRRTGQLNQLMAGSMILATACLVLDRMEILWSMMYHLLQSCMEDYHWILMAFRVFALVSGSKLFSSTGCNLIRAVVKLILSLLERERGLIEEEGAWFFPCREWFVGDEIAPDKVGYLLMEELRVLLVDLMKSSDVSSCMEDRKMLFDDDCALRKMAGQLDFGGDSMVCQVTDVVSLVELMGRYLGWEWLRRNIIPQLIDTLESCSCPQFSVPILVLICQLIRIGLKSKSITVESEHALITCLSRFLERETNLPLQFAAIEGLLILHSLDFREMVRNPFDSSRLEGSRAECSQLIRRWFSEFNEEQISSAILYFEEIKG